MSKAKEEDTMAIDWDANRNVAANIFDTIGRTPLVRLNKVTEGIKPQILVKIEYFSPTGSLKDRIFYRMITKAIERGELKPGMTIIETVSYTHLTLPTKRIV